MESIYTQPNKYGYKFNLNNPRIQELYERYKASKGYASTYPLSDGERIEFENYLQQSIEKQRRKNDEG